MKHTYPPEKDFFEHRAWKAGRMICGIDEVGRGCLAGPLVVCAALLPPHAQHEHLKDSKKLSPKKRDEMFAWLTARCTYTIATIDARIIDAVNIYQATLLAMRHACLQMKTVHHAAYASLDAILVDAMPLKLGDADPTVHHFPHGEHYSSSIAAASIIAKVTRDRLMEKLDASFPLYGFAQHKGYGTKKHRTALLEHGPTLLHRQSFLTKILPNTQDSSLLKAQALYEQTKLTPAIR